jgi:hypothetical protein
MVAAFGFSKDERVRGGSARASNLWQGQDFFVAGLHSDDDGRCSDLAVLMHFTTGPGENGPAPQPGGSVPYEGSLPIGFVAHKTC